MRLIPTDELLEGWADLDPVQALDECNRELLVRQRCFPRWITEGRLTVTDAKDRLRRLCLACAILDALSNSESVLRDSIMRAINRKPAVTSSGDTQAS